MGRFGCSFENVEKGRSDCMATTAMKLNSLLDNLEEEDYNTAISFIQYLSESRKKKNAEKSKALLSEIQEIFTDDKGWNTEESMLEDMASFRRERMRR
jgi:hypothetical protein